MYTIFDSFHLTYHYGVMFSTFVSFSSRRSISKRFILFYTLFSISLNSLCKFNCFIYFSGICFFFVTFYLMGNGKTIFFLVEKCEKVHSTNIYVNIFSISNFSMMLMCNAHVQLILFRYLQEKYCFVFTFATLR